MTHNEHLLQQIIARRVPALVQFRTARGDSTFIVHLDSPGDLQGERGIWAELYAKEGNPPIGHLIKSCSPLMVKIQHGRQELSFHSSILSHRKPFLGDTQVLLAWPASVKCRERRRSEREAIPDAGVISASIVRSADGPFPPDDVAVILVNLSLHGACLTCPGATQAPPQGQMLDLMLKFGDEQHRITTRCRRAEVLASGRLQLRVEFDPNSLPPEAAGRLAGVLEEFRSSRYRRQLNSVISGIQ